MQLPDPQYVPAVELGYLRGTMHTYWIHAKGKVSQASLNLKEKKKKGPNHFTLQLLQAKRMYTNGEYNTADGWELFMLQQLPIESEPQTILQVWGRKWS